MSRLELAGRTMVPMCSTAELHTDAAEVGWGGKLKVKDLRPGIRDQWQAQGIWNWQERAEGIRYREIKAIRLLLTGSLGDQVERE